MLLWLLLSADMQGAARLSSEIAGADSATAILQRHCDALNLSDRPRIRAVKEAVKGRVPASVRLHLRISSKEPVVHRRVALMCGPQLFSRADNWYVPSRLTTDMNTILTGSDTPFGVVVRPLKPTRQQIAVSMPPEDEKNPAPWIFTHHALVLDGQGLPIAQVAESYQRLLLATLPPESPPDAPGIF